MYIMIFIYFNIYFNNFIYSIYIFIYLFLLHFTVFGTWCLLTFEFISISYCTVLSTMWPIFSEFLIFCRLDI